MELPFQQTSQPEKDVVNSHLVLMSFIPLTALILTSLIIFIGFSSLPSLFRFLLLCSYKCFHDLVTMRQEFEWVHLT